MIQVVVTHHVCAVPAHPGTPASPARTQEYWIERLHALDETMLYTLAPVLDAPDTTTALQEAVGLIPALSEPGRALGARFDTSRDDFMAFAFKLKELAEFAKAPRPRDTNTLTLTAWCRAQLEAAAAEHPHAAEQITRWCDSMLDRFSPYAPTDDDGADADDKDPDGKNEDGKNEDGKNKDGKNEDSRNKDEHPDEEPTTESE